MEKNSRHSLAETTTLPNRSCPDLFDTESQTGQNQKIVNRKSSIVNPRDEQEMRALGATLAKELKAGDTVLLSGPLGAGKTTLVRGLLEALGHQDPVRSPTFNLIQTFPTTPPVMHADLYRVASYQGIGIEDYLDTHLCLIEWPDRAEGLVDPSDCTQIQIDFAPEGRTVKITRP